MKRGSTLPIRSNAALNALVESSGCLARTARIAVSPTKYDVS